MRGKVSVSAVLPVFNEAGAVQETLERLEGALSGADSVESFEILVVDDGSTDGSCEGLRARRARILRHDQNRGYGASLKTGIRAARHPLILICDADGSYPVEEFPRLAAAYEPQALVVARRASIPYPRWRMAKQALRGLLRLWLAALTLRRIEDINSGFRLFAREEALPLLDELSDRFSFTTGLTLGWIYDGKPIVYVPTPYRERQGDSKVNFLNDGLRVFLQTLSLTLKRRPGRLALPAALAALAAWKLTLLCF